MIKDIFKIIPLLLLPLIYSCGDTTSSNYFPFEVTVTEANGLPIEGAIMAGGYDWHSFRVVTDRWGRAELPGFARDYHALIGKNNYYSIIEDDLRSDVFTLIPTPQELREIGNIEGDLIRLENSRILTVTYQGQYRVYGYNEYDVSEILMVELPHLVVQFKLFGDSLWCTSYENGIYVYSLADPMNPAELFHLGIDGYLRAFDVKDSLVAVGANTGAEPIRLFSYHTDGSFYLLDNMGTLTAGRLYFRSHYLIATFYNNNRYYVFDVADPRDVRFEYEGGQGGYLSPIFHGDTLITEKAGVNTPGEKYHFLMIDMSDPGDPSDLGEIMAEGFVNDIIDDFTAVGGYYYGDFCVFERSRRSDFEAVAMVSEFYDYRSYHGGAPPFFLVGEKLWKLEK